jgi:hypothetical protein
MLISLIVEVISQHTHKSEHHGVYLKCKQFVKYTSIKLEK